MTTDDTATLTTRLRPHPTERALGATQVLDLPAAVAQLRAEPHHATQGHRQITIFHQTPVTMMLFAFDANGLLADHRAHGIVTIQALDGSITVQAHDTDYVLEPQQSLVLNPDVPHSVRALRPSAMLVTIHLVGEKALPPTA